MKFEQNSIVETTQNFERFAMKTLDIGALKTVSVNVNAHRVVRSIGNRPISNNFEVFPSTVVCFLSVFNRSHRHYQCAFKHDLVM